ncbi:cysteine-rich venom protein latisemin-like isoform X2 [Branchiostoma floridae x Branchiostoma belcheri]
MSTPAVFRHAGTFLSLAVILSSGMPSVRGSLTASDEAVLLEKHREFRKGVGAANMEAMTWNSELATLAQAWAETCTTSHGGTSGSSAFGGDIGQNIYKTSGSSVGDYNSVVQAWYDEVEFYNYNSASCQSGRMCTHYTQLVWAESEAVGCGAHTCSGDGTYVVCNYGPGGNTAGTKPFKTGPPCSLCGRGAGWCEDDFCVDCPTKNCTCPVECRNCGVKDTAECQCGCKDGWDGLDCSVVCRDWHKNCGKSPGWPTTQYCTDATVGEVVTAQCRVLCQQCDVVTDTWGPDVCCEGKLCENSGYLNTTQDDCGCVCPEGYTGDSCENGATAVPVMSATWHLGLLFLLMMLN